MVVIKFVDDKLFGNGQQALNLIRKIIQDGTNGNDNRRKLSKYITQALELLGDVGIPYPPELLLETVDSDNPEKPFSLNILKKLIHHPPLIELRVNGRPEAFRALMFYDNFGDKQVIFITYAFLKTMDNVNPPEMEYYASSTDMIYNDYLKNKRKYL